MRTSNPDLVRCIRLVEDAASRGKDCPDAEIQAVNSLKAESDILKFRNAYVAAYEEMIAQDVERNRKNHAVALVERGYPVQKVAAFFVHDALMFTLGHISNQRVLKSWYSALPYMTRGFPQDMYKDMFK